MKLKPVKQPIITLAEINKITRYIRQVNQNGYRPWVTVRQSHTYGQGHIIHSHKTDRPHHLLSRGERLPFFIFERDSTVVDILDQYPLPIHETLKIAEKLNIVHPGAYKERQKHNGKIPAKTMTTDFVIVRRTSDDKTTLEPYSFKYEDALDIEETDIRKVNRTKQKLKIEREFWRTQGKDLVLLTEKEFDRTEIYNLEFLRECYDHPEQIAISSELRLSIILKFRQSLIEQTQSTLKQHINHVSSSLNLSDFQALCVFQQAVYEQLLDVSLIERIELYRPITLRTGGACLAS